MPSTKARYLRKNMTDAERRLWTMLRARTLDGWKFRRQHPVGPYVLDFACLECQIVIEADGGQHADNAADLKRTAWLQEQGWTVLRYWNNDILSNASGVVEAISHTLAKFKR